MKTVRLDTTHKIIEIAPGVKFSAWTFGDQVPGQTVRARVGDKIRFSMTNRSDETLPAVRIIAAPMMHSMDFHAAMVSPQDKYRSIAPGQTITFEFTLNYPGVFMFHCGTPMILEHIASGMYGMLVFALLAVFIAGLMVGRTPEYLGKKIQVPEVKMAMLALLVPSWLDLAGWGGVLLVLSRQLPSWRLRLSSSGSSCGARWHRHRILRRARSPRRCRWW